MEFELGQIFVPIAGKRLTWATYPQQQVNVIAHFLYKRHLNSKKLCIFILPAHWLRQRHLPVAVRQNFMRTFIIISLLLLKFDIYCQIEYLFNSKGKLLIDTSFTISSQAYKVLKDFGRVPISVLQKSIQYPQLLKENYIQGLVIVSFEVTSKGEIINIKFEKSPDENFNIAISDAIKRSELSLGYYLKSDKTGDKYFRKYIKESRRQGVVFEKITEKFYIPIKFELEVYQIEKDIHKNSVITKKELVIPTIYGR